MRNILTVSYCSDIDGYKKISEEYGTAFEVNDFCSPRVLDDAGAIQEIINAYTGIHIPPGSTMHGAFYDVLIHSEDGRIACTGKYRMKQSMDIARRLGVKGVVFHTGYNPGVPGKAYRDRVVNEFSEYMGELLREYPDVNIYIENMFEQDAELLVGMSERLSQYENYGICFDYAHAVVYGRDTDRMAVMLAPYVRHIHINDNNLEEDLHLAVGSGKMDWNRFCGYCNGIFKEADILVEVAGAEEQVRSLEYMRTHFGGVVS